MLPRVAHRLPAILAFALLAIQAGLPWTARHYVTQDGPSHLYTGVVLRDLLFHRHGLYSSAYVLQRDVVPNWSSAILLGAGASLVGAAHAEKLLASACIVAGFFAFSYALAALMPGASPWTPIANFLLQNSFLVIGFYNFYLGMALFPFVVGYYARHIGKLTIRRAGLLAVALVVLFFTHIMAAVLAALCVVTLEMWSQVGGTYRRSARRAGLLIAAFLPLLAFTAVFAKASPEGVRFKPEIGRAFTEFPMDLFITGPDRSGRQDLLWPAVLFFVALGLLSVTRVDWRTPRAAILIATVLCGLLYLIAPDDGFGGQEVKKRLAWGVFVLGSLVACSAGRLHILKPAVSIYVACCLMGTLVTMSRVTRGISRTMEAYVSATDRIPEGATFVRLYYPLPNIPTRFEYQGVPLAPLYHAEAYVAARHRLVDLSDFQAAVNLFPVTYAPSIDTAHRYTLWGLEHAPNRNAPKLAWLRETLPMHIGYVVLIGEEATPEARATDMGKTLADLGSSARLLAAANPDSFVRVYECRR